jgi:hypothetical protein
VRSEDESDLRVKERSKGLTVESHPPKNESLAGGPSFLPAANSEGAPSLSRSLRKGRLTGITGALGGRV